MTSPFVVGLTGGIGSGKSTIAELFHEHGIELVDTDLLSREVVEPGAPALTQIAAHFGTAALAADGSLARNKLRELIFADEAEKQWLEDLLHPLIAELMKRRIESCSSAYCLLVSPLLLETKQHLLADRILVVDVSEATQLERTLLRDQSNEATIRSIIAAQISRSERLQRADDILDNGQQMSTLRARVDELHTQYLSLAQESHEI